MAKRKKAKKNTSTVPKALRSLTPAKRKAVKAWAASQCRVKSSKKKKSTRRRKK